MDRHERVAELWRRRIFSSRLFARTIASAGMLGAAWGLTAHAAPPTRPQLRPVLKSAAPAPLRFDDVKRMLNDSDPAMRLEAVRYLEALDLPADETLSLLKPHLNDVDLVVRAQALHAALHAGLPSNQGIAAARQMLVPTNPKVCCMAAQILGESGPAAREALPELKACLADSSLWIPLHAARAIVRIDPHDAQSIDLLRNAYLGEQGEVHDFAGRSLDEAAQKLVRNLQNQRADVRLAAATSFEHFHTAAAGSIPALVGRFQDSDLRVRLHAIRAAYRAGANVRQVVVAASDLLIPESPDVLRPAAMLLAEIGADSQEALPKLHACLSSPTVAARLPAAEAALRIDPFDSAAFDALTAALADGRADVRYFAVNSLGSTAAENDRGIFALHCAMADANPMISAAAALQLSRTHNELRRDLEQNAIVLAGFDGTAPGHEYTWVRELAKGAPAVQREAAIHLAMVGPEAQAALPTLAEHLNDPNPSVRLAVAYAVWEISNDAEAVLPVLADLLTSRRADIRIGAAYALGCIGPEAQPLVSHLSHLLRSGQPFERLIFAASLAKIDQTHDSAFSVLLRGLESADVDVRYLAIVALGGMPLSLHSAVEEALQPVIQDGNGRIRTAAYESLNQMLLRKSELETVQHQEEWQQEDAAEEAASNTESE